MVLPLPLGPATPTRSPGPSRQVTSSSRTRGPAVTVTPRISSTVLPSRAVAILVSSTVSRGGGSAAISAVAASIRNCGLLVRAGGPRRSQASSLRSRLRRRRSVASGDPGPFRAGQHVGRVAALVGVHLPAGHLPGPVAGLVQEPAVVGDDHVGRRVPAQEAGQPADRLDVEVVRGLVEEQQIPRRGEERGQRDPAALPAGQPPGLPVQVQAAEQGAGHLAGPRVRGPGVLGHARAEDQVTDPAVKLVRLREVAEAQPARVGDPAGVQLAVAVPARARPARARPERARPGRPAGWTCRPRSARQRQCGPRRPPRATPGPAVPGGRTPWPPPPG